MGSFLWDNDYSDMCYSQYHNGRPLSVALTEPFQASDTSHYIDSDFAANQYQFASSSANQHQYVTVPTQQQCISGGGRFKREYYSIDHPHTHCNSYWHSPQIPRRPLHRCCSSGNVLVERIKTVTVEEPQYRPMMHVCTAAPIVRQVKIRPRPSSCVNLRYKDVTDNRLSRYVDHHNEQSYQYEYTYHRPTTQTIKIQRDPTPPRVSRHDATTATDDLYIPKPKPPPPPVEIRRSMRDAATTTKGLPRPNLSKSETQVLERYETDIEVLRGISKTTTISEPTIISTKTIVEQRPIQQSYNVVSIDDSNYQKSSSKTQRKDFYQRMQVQNGATSKSHSAFNIYSNYDGSGQTVIRPTARPFEALVDTSSITVPSNDAFEPINFGKNYQTRSYFEQTDSI